MRVGSGGCQEKTIVLCLVTYKISFGAQPLPAILVEKALQEITGCHCAAHGDLERLVQNVLVHLGHILAVEGGLGRDCKRPEDYPCSGTQILSYCLVGFGVTPAVAQDFLLTVLRDHTWQCMI